MRAFPLVKTVAAVCFVSFATVSFLASSSFAAVHAHAQAGAAWTILRLAASACAAKLALPFTLFGARVEIGAPVFLLLALPFFARLLLRDKIARAASGWFGARRSVAPAAPGRGSQPAPYALPTRVAVALAAAARARR